MRFFSNRTSSRFCSNTHCYGHCKCVEHKAKTLQSKDDGENDATAAKVRRCTFFSRATLVIIFQPCCNQGKGEKQKVRRGDPKAVGTNSGFPSTWHSWYTGCGCAKSFDMSQTSFDGAKVAEPSCRGRVCAPASSQRHQETRGCPPSILHSTGSRASGPRRVVNAGRLSTFPCLSWRHFELDKPLRRLEQNPGLVSGGAREGAKVCDCSRMSLAPRVDGTRRRFSKKPRL
ncbi:hypothetical protein HDK77DRAFT_109976 [Phyllosticta capitalensis]|uniref:Uncharacterized protein n=1 Tax=Phyllosticta capitalensis TaxID=121624 RepID=A0ABR1YBY2_9PEZI